MRVLPVALAALLLALPLAGCLAPRAALVPGTGGVTCGVPALATWQEPGLFEALAHEGHPQTPAPPGIPLRAPALAERWGLPVLAEVHFQAERGAQSLSVEPREGGYLLAFAHDARLPPGERAARFDALVARLTDAPPATRAAWLAEEDPRSKGRAGDVPIAHATGLVQGPLDATALWESLSAAPPAREHRLPGGGRATLHWEEGAAPGDARVFLSFLLPHRDVELTFGGGTARLGVDGDGGAALFARPQLLEGVPPEGREAVLRAMVVQSFLYAGLPEPALGSFRVDEEAWRCPG